MALLDISEVLTDPDFMDNGLVCERSKEIVNDDGMVELTTETFTFSAVVTTNEGTRLEREMDLERISGSITVHSIFKLIDGSGDLTADIITWKGKRYTVTKIDDYGHFGRGFTKAICNIIPVSG